MTREEIGALKDKHQELQETIDILECRLGSVPYNEKMVPLRVTMEQMLVELRRMDKNLQTILRNNQVEETEGGINNGSY